MKKKRKVILKKKRTWCAGSLTTENSYWLLASRKTDLRQAKMGFTQQKAWVTLGNLG